MDLASTPAIPTTRTRTATSGMSRIVDRLLLHILGAQCDLRTRTGTFNGLVAETMGWSP